MARELLEADWPVPLVPAVDEDLQYVARVRAGDIAAFQPLWEKYERVLHVFFLRRTRNRLEAEDLTSETLVAALQAIPRFRGLALADANGAAPRPCTFRTFVMKIAHRHAGRWLNRRRARREVAIGDLARQSQDPAGGDVAVRGAERADESQPDPVASVIDAEQSEAMYCALASIDSAAQFKVILLHYFAGLTHQDIATVLTTRTETVNSRLQDGRRTFRGHYERLNPTSAEP
jgi:RNA polymerase sigma factor (sigma-70 family)